MRISDWSSDVCSSDLVLLVVPDSQYIFGILFVNRVPFPFLVRIKLDTNGSVRPCCIDRQQGYSGCACSLCYSGHIEHISRGAFVGLLTDGEINVLCRRSASLKGYWIIKGSYRRGCPALRKEKIGEETS